VAENENALTKEPPDDKRQTSEELAVNPPKEHERMKTLFLELLREHSSAFQSG
jgi:hypothetical protein